MLLSLLSMATRKADTEMKKTLKTLVAELETNIVKLTCGPAVVRFEIDKGSEVAMRYAATGGGKPVSLGAAREEIATLKGLGWMVAAA